MNERINARIVAGGHRSLRPVHGMVFARIDAGGASINDIAAHIGVTKQSAAAIVESLEEWGYVSRRVDPGDKRARLIELTATGRQVTALATAAAAAEAGALADRIGERAVDTVFEALQILGTAGAPPEAPPVR
ncbi:MarR family winged helix-turn-helix transcriptional regulator [Gordonia sp. NPDC003425]